MDTERIDALGLGPITDDLALAAAARTPQDVVAALGRFARDGFGGLVHAFVNTDDRDSSRYVVYLEQGGIGLPDESYYREERPRRGRARHTETTSRACSRSPLNPTPRHRGPHPGAGDEGWRARTGTR